MKISRASHEAVRWVCTGSIVVALLLVVPPSAIAQYQSMGWEETDSGGPGRPNEDREEEDERNVAKNISITIDGAHIPIPGRGEFSTDVAVTVRAVGNKGPLAGARVKFEVIGPAGDFVRAPGGFSMEQPVLNSSGEWGTTLYVSTPSMTDLGVFPSQLQLRATLSDKDGGLGQASRTFPLGAILIHGATVGPPDPEVAPLVMKGRYEPPPTSIWNGFIHSTARQNGEFFVLTKIPTRKMTIVLNWPDNEVCHLPLKFSVDISPVPNLSYTLSTPIELLSPEEHQGRVKALVKEFAEAMPLTTSARSRLLNSLQQLPFTTGEPGGVPSYKSTTLNTLGEIRLPGGPKAYWADNLIDVAGAQTDPAYAITFHEMGHFVHQQLIESFRWKMFYNIDKYLGSSHSTWSAPDTKFDSAKSIVSFNESTADFFAYLIYIFVDQRHPEFRRSQYYHRSYLAQFDTETKARSVASTKGCMIEGVQTSFLRALYGDRVGSAPAVVYADYLRIMLQYEDDSWFTPFIPARTISEWIGTKSRHQTLGTTAKPADLARQFNIMPCDKQPQILINPTGSAGTYVVNGSRVDANEKSKIGSLLIGDQVTIRSGTFTISNVNPESGQFTVIQATPGATFRIVSANEIYVSKGLIGVKGPVTISSPSGRATPKGTVWTIEVADSGDATVKVLEGSVLVENSKERATLGKGNAATLRKKSIKRSSFNPADPALTSIFALSGGASIFTDAPPPAPAPVSTPSPSAPVATPAPQPTGLTFYAVRQKATGQCVVVVGTQGITAGDTVYGAFTGFEQAQNAVQNQCLGGQGSAPPPAPATASSETQPAAPVVNSAFASPVLAVPKFDNDDSTKGIFFVNLDSGNAFFIDKVKGSPQTVRTRAINQNVFEVLGRQPGDAARNGQVLIGPVRKSNGTVHALYLVDTTTGKMGYITDLENRSFEGRLRHVKGAPAGNMASDDGNFTLVMHQDRSGKTDGALLYNGTTGKSAYFYGVGALEPELKPFSTTPLPPTGGGVSSLAIVAGSEVTDAMLLLDPVSGSLHYVVMSKKKAWEFQISTLPHNLFDVFPTDAAVQTPHRFVFVPLTSGSGATDRALIIDVGSGAIALLDKLRNTKKLSLKPLNRNIYTRLTRNVARPRVITAVPKVNGSGATGGAWLFDSVTGKILFLDELLDPKNLRILKVEEKVR